MQQSTKISGIPVIRKINEKHCEVMSENEKRQDEKRDKKRRDRMREERIWDEIILKEENRGLVTRLI